MSQSRQELERNFVDLSLNYSILKDEFEGKYYPRPPGEITQEMVDGAKALKDRVEVVRQGAYSALQVLKAFVLAQEPPPNHMLVGEDEEMCVDWLVQRGMEGWQVGVDLYFRTHAAIKEAGYIACKPIV